MSIKTYILLVIVLLRVIAFAKTENPDLRDCLTGTSADACGLVAGQLKAQGKYEDSMRAHERACELNLDETNCSQSYWVAQKIGKKSAGRILELMKKRCESHARICKTLAYIYEEQKNFPEVAKLAQKYKYGYLLYLYGDKKEAYPLILQECKNQDTQCAFFLRYIPDHPQYDQILKIAESSCKNASYVEVGASTCAIIGMVHYKRRNFQSAYDFWSYDCKKNAMSCLLIVGTEKPSKIQFVEALNNFCDSELNSDFHIEELYAMAKNYCEKKDNIVVLMTAPPEIKSYADRLIKEFLKEQH